MEDAFATLPVWLKAIVYGIVASGLGGYTVFRVMKRDGHSDAIDDKTQQFIDNLKEQLDAERREHNETMERERAHAAKREEVIERLSRERNEAVTQVGRLEGDVKALEREVHSLREQNKKLTGEVHEMRREMNTMSKQFAAAIAVNQELINEIRAIGARSASQ